MVRKLFVQNALLIISNNFNHGKDFIKIILCSLKRQSIGKIGEIAKRYQQNVIRQKWDTLSKKYFFQNVPLVTLKNLEFKLKIKLSCSERR